MIPRFRVWLPDTIQMLRVKALVRRFARCS
nr:MAG TPA: Holliday junction resolvase Gen1 C-terminal domain [Caudoviricetes sp.]